MIPKIAIKNPGCQFCKHYQSSFVYKSHETRPVCTKGGRRIYASGGPFGLRHWKWVDCGSAEHRNRTRLCEDFEVDGIFTKLLRALQVLLNRGGQQTPPAFKTELWWQGPDYF